MKDYRELTVWQRSHVFTSKLSRVTKSFPPVEVSGLVSRIRRAAASLPADSAAGCARDGDAELKRVPNIALGSASEVDDVIRLATELGYLGAKQADPLANESLRIRRMLGTFVQELKA